VDNLQLIARALAAVIVVSAAIVIITSGESVAVRYLTGLVAADIAVRLVSHAERRPVGRTR
jgi:hypothetical protein